MQIIKAYHFIIFYEESTKIFIDEIYSKPPEKKSKTTKIIYNYIDEIWSIDSADFSDYKISNNKWYRYTLIIFHNFPNLYLVYTTEKQKWSNNDKRNFK